MSRTWRGESDLRLPPVTAGGRLRAVRRGVPAIALIGLGLVVLLPVRAVERALVGPRRAWSTWITVAVCWGSLRLMGLRVLRTGRPMTRPGAFVANHASWVDILVLNAQAPLVFVAKSEVRGWGALGWLARATGTVFVRREARGEAGAQAEAVAQAIRAGSQVLFFPEGTSTDNRRVLPFRAPLFAALKAPGLPEDVAVQPVTLRYDLPLLAWYGDTPLDSHMLAVLTTPGPLRAAVTFHPPIPAAGGTRKTLAAEAEAAVRSAL